LEKLVLVSFFAFLLRKREISLMHNSIRRNREAAGSSDASFWVRGSAAGLIMSCHAASATGCHWRRVPRHDMFIAPLIIDSILTAD